MKRLVKKRELISMDLTPLIDVVFLLLIFFIVASEFKKNETILNLTLPNASSSVKIVEKKDFVIELSQTKVAFLGEKIDFDTLNIELEKLKKDTALTVKIDKDVKYSKVIKLLDILNHLSLNNLMLVTKEK